MNKEMIMFVRSIDNGVVSELTKEYIVQVGGFNKAMQMVFENNVKDAYPNSVFESSLSNVSPVNFVKFLAGNKIKLCYYMNNVYFMLKESHEWYSLYLEGEMNLRDVGMYMLNQLDKYLELS